jgi:bacteriocin biosynthesis cyclodehydratase domain-containing protein
MTRYALNAALPVLRRPDEVVQVGWDPRRAVLVRPPPGLTAADLADLLRSLQSGATLAELRTEASRRGLTEAGLLVDLIESLVEAGVVTAGAPRRRTRSASIRIHGRGPLSDLLADGLRCSGARIRHSGHSHAAPAPAGTDLAVLSDYLVADPHLVRELHRGGVPHLLVRVRDGTGLVGPLVIPGVTSCLTCADLHRSDRDAAWPAVAAQLRDRVGSADRATVLATAALALNQVDRVIRAVRGARTDPPPPTLDTTLEFDVNASSIVARKWTRHPRCSC